MTQKIQGFLSCIIVQFVFAFFFINPLMACPNCAGSSTSDDNTKVMIIWVFIAICYIPMFYFFKSAYNKRKTVPTSRNDC